MYPSCWYEKVLLQHCWLQCQTVWERVSGIWNQLDKAEKLFQHQPCFSFFSPAILADGLRHVSGWLSTWWKQQLGPHLPLYGHVVLLLPLLLFTPVIIKPMLAHAVLQCFVGKSAASQCMGRWVWPCPGVVKGKDLEQRVCAITATPFISSEGQTQESLSSTGQAKNANQRPATAVIFTCKHFSVLFVFGADTSAILLYFGLTWSCWSVLNHAQCYFHWSGLIPCLSVAGFRSTPSAVLASWLITIPEVPRQ